MREGVSALVIFEDGTYASARGVKLVFVTDAGADAIDSAGDGRAVPADAVVSEIDLGALADAWAPKRER